jgi:uncharacterized protein (TIGR02145 family)
MIFILLLCASCSQIDEGIEDPNLDSGSNQESGIVFNPNLTYGTVKDIENNSYKTIKIGNQVWMAENLRTTKYNDGTAIPLVTDYIDWDALRTPGYCWYDNDKDKYAATYGALYNWYAVETDNLCPVGWRVPSDEDWKTLEMHVGMSQTDADYRSNRGSDEGGKLKEMDFNHWEDPNYGATNSSGFTGMPGGYRARNGGTFHNVGYDAFWWSSTAYSDGEAWYRRLYHDAAYVYRYPFRKSHGYSVRCLKD